VIVIDAEGLSASRPNRPLFADVSLTVSDGDRIGIVGINGCGKSTLLRIISGELTPDTGVVRYGRNARIGVLPQQPALPDGSVLDAVTAGLDEPWKGESALSKLGMGDMFDARTDQLSGGQQKRVALAALLCREWEALILDEPTNHLDLDAIAYLEEWLANYTGGLLLVTHDRHVLDRVTTKVLEIDRGKTYLHVPAGIHAGSGYAAYLAARVEREENAATAEQVRRNAARKELAWLRRGAPARSTKPKARVEAAKNLIAQRADAPARQGDLGLNLGSQRLGSKGVEIDDVSFTWPGNHTSTLSHVSHTLEPGDRIGIVGPNGAGKSTLLDLVAHRISPDSGTVTLGKTVKIGYYDQLGRDLDVNQRVRDAVIGDKGDPSVEDLHLMRSFWFDGDAQFAPIHTLSGGERRRLQLLLTLVEQPNVLLLDEPTRSRHASRTRGLPRHVARHRGGGQPRPHLPRHRGGRSHRARRTRQRTTRPRWRRRVARRTPRNDSISTGIEHRFFVEATDRQADNEVEGQPQHVEASHGRSRTRHGQSQQRDRKTHRRHGSRRVRPRTSHVTQQRDGQGPGHPRPGRGNVARNRQRGRSSGPRSRLTPR
jgi:ATP-binding cassette subfamily F protein uup